ncbi:MAG TPA: helix-turn-helix domain-containing protein [Candidatus Binataceae bacterium]|nr:helix-turn-helix domain-containing protein [Candidatus Binataceae bacterium]
MKLALIHNRDDQGYCRACEALSEAFGVGFCRTDGSHVRLTELVAESDLAQTLCNETRLMAILRLTSLASNLAAGMAEDQPRSSEPAPLIDAAQMAKHLNLPESWVRSEQRAGRIPFVQAGRYVRFNAAEVEAAIRQRS